MNDELKSRIARAEEWAIHNKEAAVMTAEAFAEKYGSVVEVRIPDGTFKIVVVGAVDYYWWRDDGHYDGWGMSCG